MRLSSADIFRLYLLKAPSYFRIGIEPRIYRELNNTEVSGAEHENLKARINSRITETRAHVLRNVNSLVMERICTCVLSDIVNSNPFPKKYCFRVNC